MPSLLFLCDLPTDLSTLPWIPIIGSLLSLLCLGLAIRAARRKRLVDNIPTSKTSGVFMGLVELKGTAEAEKALCSFLAEIPCVFHQWQVQEHWSRTVTETYRDSNGKSQTRTRHESGWTTVAQGGDAMPFYLKDDAGIIQVRPDGADIEAQQVFNQTCTRSDPLYYAKGPQLAISNSDHRRCFSEKAIPLHASLYIMGQAREREDIVAAEIAKSDQAPVFLISTKTEEEISSGHAWAHALLGLLGAVLVVGGLAWQINNAGGSVSANWPLLAKATGLYAGIWLVWWIWMAFNSLIELRQRVRQAWSNIDVQLKRRCNLIPSLVEVVKGMRDYEHTVQAELAQLRTELSVTAPGKAGPDPRACHSTVAAIAESYPELKVNNAFLALSKELATTEDRIALAREYFNDIATFYNTRLETIPDCWLAALGAMKPQPPMATADFVRQPVVVNLDP